MPNKYQLSEDELIYYQQRADKTREPIQKAVEILEAGICAVLAELGVDISKNNIPEQQQELGIIMQEHTDERAPQLNGFYIYQVRGGEIVPIAWVGAARVDSAGKAWIDIQWFARNTHDSIGGIKIAK